MSKQETVKVRVQVPKEPMDLLEKNRYFGWSKKEFFVAAVRSVVSAEISELPAKVTEHVYAKYGRGIDVIYPPHFHR